MSNNKRVVMTLSNDLSRDGRVQKEAQSLSSAGFEVYVVGIGTKIDKNLANADYNLILTQHSVGGQLVAPRLGREDVFWPLRVFVNLTLGAWREWKFERIQTHGYPSRYSIPAMQKIVEDLQPDIVHCHDLDTLLPGYRAAKKTRAKLVYDSHELFLEQHTLPQRSRDIYKRIEKLVFPHIDALVTISPDVGEILCKTYQRMLDYVVLYNGGSQINSVLKQSEKPVKLFFQGSFAHDRNNIELIEAMDCLRGEATLTLQGWGQDKEAYEETINKFGLEDTVKIIDPCGPLEVVDSASNYDVGVINSLCVDENFKHTLPNKFFDYMCAGLAIASTNLPPIKKIIEECKCGITFEQKGAKNTGEVLKKLVSDPQKIDEMKSASTKSAPEYAWPAQAEKLQKLYRSLSE